MSMDNISEIFFVECDELLQDMEEKLLAWNSCADNIWTQSLSLAGALFGR